MELIRKLKQRQAEGNPIAVGLIGCGQMGSGLAHTINNIDGMAVRAIADVDVDRGVQTFGDMRVPAELVSAVETLSQAQDALSTGGNIVTADAELLTQIDAIEANVEATGVPDIGAQIALRCIENRKPIIMLNVETDVTVGPLLHRLAQKCGCVYTAASGDEPGVCKMLFNMASSLGFEVVCLGKGKNNPIDLDATPDSCREEAERRGMNPKMLAAFKDGSKTMVELAAMSNATGLVPDVPGMHGPKVDVDELHRVLIPTADGGVLSRSGCVDYSTGRVAPGVFAVITSSDPRIREDMKFLSMGDGPYYTLYRPYHLCNVETPISVAEAVLYGESTIASRWMVSEVATVAKRDLKPGDVVGQIGEVDFFGRTYTYAEAQSLRAVPLGLAPGGRVLKAISKGELLTEANFTPDATKFVYQLRQMQDAQLAMERQRL